MSGRSATFILIFNFVLISCLPLAASVSSDLLLPGINQQDTLPGNQLLYNGRYWRNRYSMIKGDQYFASGEFLPGTVTLNGNIFRNISLRYDIYNDEIMIPAKPGLIIQLNKEMVDSFTLDILSKRYLFANIKSDSLKGFRGYLHVLYEGESALYVKYYKEIQLLAVDKKYDLFYQVQRVYFVKDKVVYTLSGKNELLKLLSDYKIQIRDFIKKNKLKMSKKDPGTFVPVIRYYDSLKK